MKSSEEILDVGLSLGETLATISIFPLTALLEKLDSFHPFKYVSFS
jgi:hypothetical protein